MNTYIESNNKKKYSICTCIYVCLSVSIVHASGSAQLQAQLQGPLFSHCTPTPRAVTWMGSNDMVVGEDHMSGTSFLRHIRHTGRCGSVAIGSTPRRGKTLISNPRCLADVSTCGKDFRR